MKMLQLTKREYMFLCVGFVLACLYFRVTRKKIVDEPRSAIVESVENAQDGGKSQILDSGLNSSNSGDKMLTKVPECASTMRPASHAFMFMISHSGTTGMITEVVSHDQVGNYTRTLDLEPLVRCRGDVDCETETVEQVYADGYRNKKMGILKYNGRTMPRNLERWRKFFSSDLQEPPYFLFMYRENLFKRAVGRYPYNHLNYEGHFGGLKAGEPDRCELGELCSFEVEPEKVLCEMKRSQLLTQTVRELVKEFSECHLEIRYEDYLYNREKTMFAMEDFLHLPRGGTFSERKKATSDNMCEVVENYAEICAAFNECTRWSWMINDHQNNCLCENFQYTSLGGDGVNPYCELKQLDFERGYCVAENSV